MTIIVVDSILKDYAMYYNMMIKLELDNSGARVSLQFVGAIVPTSQY